MYFILLSILFSLGLLIGIIIIVIAVKPDVLGDHVILMQRNTGSFLSKYAHKLCLENVKSVQKEIEICYEECNKNIQVIKTDLRE